MYDDCSRINLMNQSRMYDRLSRKNQAKKILGVLEDFLGTKRMSQANLLDVGCFNGMITTRLAQRVKRVHGIDIDAQAIAYAKKNNKKKNLHFMVMDGLTMAVADESFDIVVCHQVYEHVEDSQQLFAQIYRLLRPGGVCYLAAMNKWYPIEPHLHLPFLTYVPHLLDVWNIRPKSYWQLRRETEKFSLFDYTQKILNNSKKYNYTLPFSFGIFAKIVAYVSPTFIWVLKK